MSFPPKAAVVRMCVTASALCTMTLELCGVIHTFCVNRHIFCILISCDCATSPGILMSVICPLFGNYVYARVKGSYEECKLWEPIVNAQSISVYISACTTQIALLCLFAHNLTMGRPTYFGDQQIYYN